MEIIFSRPSEARTIPLRVIADRTKLSVEDCGASPHEEPFMKTSEKTKKKICNLLASTLITVCKNCEEREKAMQDIEDPETISVSFEDLKVKWKKTRKLADTDKVLTS
ncbi:hypothetical protein K1719_046028 [Acacia pycnantha]|nr:hypothetical protein K1719_046028 [Acacia pycnantha]